jgi:hypothetical protein
MTMESESKSLTVEEVVELIRNGESLPKDFRNNGKNAFTAFAKQQPGKPVVELYRDVDGYVDGLGKRDLVPSSICNYLDYLKTGLKHVEAIRNLFSEEEASQLTLQIASKAKSIRSVMHKESKSKELPKRSTKVSVVKEDAGEGSESIGDDDDELEDDDSTKGEEEDTRMDKLLDVHARLEKTLAQIVSEKEELLRREVEHLAEIRRLNTENQVLTKSNELMLNFIREVPEFCENDSKMQSVARAMCRVFVEP